MRYLPEYQTKKQILYFIESQYEEGAFFYINYMQGKILIRKIKPFEFVEQDIIDYNPEDEEIIGVINNVSLSHYINMMVFFHNQIGSTQHNFPDLWRVMKFVRVTRDDIDWCVENDKLHGVNLEQIIVK